MNPLEKYFNEEFLRSEDKSYHELNIEKFRRVINHPKVIEPLDYLLNIEPKVGVAYKRYLYVKALQSKLVKNGKNFELVEEYWKVWVKE